MKHASQLISFTFIAANVTCDTETCTEWKPFNKSWYHISENKNTWPAARTKCIELGGHLLKIDDQAELKYFINEFKNMKDSVGKMG